MKPRIALKDLRQECDTKHHACSICVHSNSAEDGFKVGEVRILLIAVPSMSSMEQSSLLLYNNEICKQHHGPNNLITNTLFQCVWLEDGELKIYNRKGIFFCMGFINKGTILVVHTF